MPRKPNQPPRSNADNPGQFKPGRRPHNKKPAPELESLEALMRRLAAEPRTVIKDGKTVKMTAAERHIRKEVDAAAAGKVRPLAQLIKLMLKYPSVVRDQGWTEVIYRINGPLARV